MSYRCKKDKVVMGTVLSPENFDRVNSHDDYDHLKGQEYRYQNDHSRTQRLDWGIAHIQTKSFTFGSVTLYFRGQVQSPAMRTEVERY